MAGNSCLEKLLVVEYVTRSRSWVALSGSHMRRWKFSAARYLVASSIVGMQGRLLYAEVLRASEDGARGFDMRQMRASAPSILVIKTWSPLSRIAHVEAVFLRPAFSLVSSYQGTFLAGGCASALGTRRTPWYQPRTDY